MKKIFIIGIITLSIFIIYLTTIDKKIYYLILGDEISLGLTKTGYYEKNYAEYIKEYLETKNKLEIYTNEYVAQGYRITDIINDINENKEKEYSKKTIKNALIKADLLTISIGTNDIISKIQDINRIDKTDYNKLIKNIETITTDLEKLLKLVREYCKEDIILIGIYINTPNEKINEISKMANEQFKKISEKYNVEYINLYEILSSNEYIYPNKEDHQIISTAIKEIINKNLLKN